MRIRYARGELDVSRPVIMGVVNASPESFSDSVTEAAATVTARADQALGMADAGAHIVDIGGQSARTDEDELPVDIEIDRVVPLIATIRERSDVCISVDTYRAPVIRAALDAGADIINDVSGGRDRDAVAEVAARHAGLVVMHTRLSPKQRLAPTDRFYTDADAVVVDVVEFLDRALGRLESHGVSRDQVIIDPGPDFAKTPAQTVAVLTHLERLTALGRPVLLALSRKDFIGAATNRPPRQRAAGTVAALSWCVSRAPHSVLRVHDVAAAVDALAVLDVLEGRRTLEWDTPLADHLRYDR